MRRRELYRTVKSVELAFGSQRQTWFNGIFGGFYFNGLTVAASDSIVTAQAPCRFDFTGAVDGRAFSGLLAKSRVEEPVRAAIDDGKMVVTMGSAEWRMPLIDNTIEMPEPSGIEIEVGDMTVEALRACAVTLGVDPTHAWRMGVTLDPSPGRLDFYSDSEHVATRASVARDVPGELEPVILPPRFVQAILQAESRDLLLTLHIAAERVWAVFANGLIVSQARDSHADPARFAGVFEMAGIDGAADRLPIPPDLAIRLDRLRRSVRANRDGTERIIVALVDGDDGPELTIEPADREPRCGSLLDAMPADETHEPSSVKTYAGPLLRALQGIDQMTIIPDHCVALRGSNVVRLVVISTVKPEQPERRERPSDKLARFLFDLFADGQPRDATEVLAEIGEAEFGVSSQTIANTRRRCGIVSKKQGSRWVWSVEDQDQPLEKAG